jgi:hypothetical protein
VFVVAPGRSAEYILNELRRRIDVAFLPRPLCLVPELPRNALGKLPFQEMQRLIAEARKPYITFGKPFVSTEQQIVSTGRDPVISSGTLPGQIAGSRPGQDATGLGIHEPGADTEEPGSTAVETASAAVGFSGMATIHFPVGHPAAEGHFPGNPIIPGALLLREIVAAILDPNNPSGAPFEILRAKFLVPVRPGSTVEIRWAGAGGEVRFTCTAAGSDRPSVTGAVRLPSS